MASILASQLILKITRYLTPVLFAVAFGFLVFRIGHAFQTVPPDLASDDHYGTAAAPYSDALTWLKGALIYVFHHAPYQEGHRPTVGLMFGSILAATGKIEAIPAFFAIAILVAFPVLYFLAPNRVRLPFAACLLLLAWPGVTALRYILFGSLNSDVPALFFGFGGTLFLFCGIHRREGQFIALVTAFLLLGLAAVFRGTGILAIPGLIWIAAASLPRGRRLAGSALMVFIFLLPLIIDLSLRKTYDVTNHTSPILYCVLTEPGHTWTSVGQQRYFADPAAQAGLFGRYVRFLFSFEGFSVIGGFAWQRLAMDGLLLGSTAGIVSCLAVAVGALTIKIRNGRVRPWEIAVAAALPGLCIVVWLFPFLAPFAAVLLIAAMAAGATGQRLPLVACCLLLYLSGLVILSVIGMAWHDRYAASFSFALFFGVFLLYTEKTGVDKPAGSPWGLRSFSAGVSGGIALLYVLVFLLPFGPRQTFLTEVSGKNAAMVIASEARLDRTLYFTGDGQLFYTHDSGTAPWTVRDYAVIDAPAGLWNGSFLHPAEFVTAPRGERDE